MDCRYDTDTLFIELQQSKGPPVMRFVVTSAIVLCLQTSAVLANSGSLIERYYDALKMDEVFQLLQDEGVEGAVEIAQDDEAITLSPAWTSRARQIYSIEKMDAAFRLGLAEATDLSNSEEAIAFFETELGQRIVDIELAARTALSDDAAEEAAVEMAETLREADPDRVALYERFIEANNLVDSNVMGALNANLAFYRGLGTNELFGGLDEGSMLSQVYTQEPEIRSGMEEWTMNFSVLAYSLLSEEEMSDYIAMSEAPSGQQLNSALFAGFDQVFEMHSFELGRAMAEFMAGDDT